MRKFIAGMAAVGIVLVPVSEGLARGPQDSCMAFNPAQPKCSFTVSENASTPVSGAVGRGDWVVTVKRGKTKFLLKSPSGGDPTATSFAFQKGDKVTAKAITPGSGVLTGGS
jgi:hypothetical protein